MASSIHNALNELLTNFSDAGKNAPFAAQQQRQQQTQAAIAQSEEAGHNALAGQQQQDSRRAFYFQQVDAKRQSLKDYGSPQIELAPSDQVDLFATGYADTRLIGKLSVAAPSLPEDANAILDQTGETNGTDIAQSIEVPVSQSLKQKAQAAVGALYARNSNVVYNVTPAISEAA